MRRPIDVLGGHGGGAEHSVLNCLPVSPHSGSLSATSQKEGELVSSETNRSTSSAYLRTTDMIITIPLSELQFLYLSHIICVSGWYSTDSNRDQPIPQSPGLFVFPQSDHLSEIDRAAQTATPAFLFVTPSGTLRQRWPQMVPLARVTYNNSATGAGEILIKVMSPRQRQRRWLQEKLTIAHGLFGRVQTSQSREGQVLARQRLLLASQASWLKCCAWLHTKSTGGGFLNLRAIQFAGQFVATELRRSDGRKRS